MVEFQVVENLALALPEAVANQHFSQPDIRVRGRIFVTLRPDEQRVVLKLSAENQMAFMGMNPDGFSPVKGSWGEKGWTLVHIDEVEQEELEEAIFVAWKQVAPKRLIKEYLSQRDNERKGEGNE